MESRISAESLPAIYDSGCSGLAFDRSAFDSQIFWDRVDFDQVLASSHPAQTLSEISTQRLYYSLIERGPADCLEVLPYINKEQFLSILDYDVWRRDEFIPERVLYWMDLLRQVSPQRAFEQFCDLEEEYQISTLSPYIRIYDQEAYEKMTDVDQDRLQRLPGDALFYSIETQDDATLESVKGLIDCIMDLDMNYVLSLIAHAGCMPQNESSQMAAQFRKARLEEDGFVTYEDSLTCFAEMNPHAFKAKLRIPQSSSRDLISTGLSENSFFLDRVFEYAKNIWSSQELSNAQQGLVHLANNLCAVTQVEADDLNTLKFIFANGKALSSLGLEFLSDGNLHLAASLLLEVYPKELFRVGLNLVRTHQSPLVDKMCDLQIPKSEQFKKYFHQQSYALMLDWIDKNLLDRIGLEYSEMLKGLFNRFPQYPKEINADVKRISFFPISNLSELNLFQDISKRMALCFQEKFLS